MNVKAKKSSKLSARSGSAQRSSSGFVAVLAILAGSMAFAYFGFERIAGAVDLLPDQRLGGGSGPDRSIAS